MKRRKEEYQKFVFENTRAGGLVVEQRKQGLQFLHGDAGRDTKRQYASHIHLAVDWNTALLLFIINITFYEFKMYYYM